MFVFRCRIVERIFHSPSTMCEFLLAELVEVEQSNAPQCFSLYNIVSHSEWSVMGRISMEKSSGLFVHGQGIRYLRRDEWHHYPTDQSTHTLTPCQECRAMEAEYESMANSPRLQRLIAWEPYRAYIHGNRAYRLLLESSLGVLKVTK